MRRGGPPVRIASSPMELDAHRRAAVGAVGAVSTRERGELQTFTCSACGIEPVGLRPGICRECERRQSAAELELRRAERLLIPPRFRWARLDRLPFAPEGVARPCAHPEAVRRVRASRASVLVLRGETRRGKTVLACAKLAALDAEGLPGVFVRCQDLSGSSDEQDRAVQLYRRALSARAVALDDLGKELGGAPSASAMSAFRGDRACKLIRDLHDESGVGAPTRRMIVTLAQSDNEIATSHGGDIWGRLLDRDEHGIEVIDLDTIGGRL